MLTKYNNAILTGDMVSLLELKTQIYPPNKKIYRYRFFDSHWYSNIIKGKVYMSSPAKFNDPFDGNMYGYANSLYLGLLNSKGTLPSYDFQVMNADGEIRDFTDVLKSHQDKFKDCFCIACFSEKLDLMTMWAHYASNHTGYVIEYDLTKLTSAQSKNLYKMAYFSREQLENAVFSTHRLPIFNLIHKDAEWDYEKEWRMIKIRDGTDYEDLSNCISAVYLGMCFPKQHYQDELAIIQDRFKNTGAELREMHLSNTGSFLISREFHL
ncbi:MAG: DUF2971 domain-containing protein [Clostridia bacterium]|nr:DUF2971 domain-containing protein [Clostridia bacterium]